MGCMKLCIVRKYVAHPQLQLNIKIRSTSNYTTATAAAAFKVDLLLESNRSVNENQ